MDQQQALLQIQQSLKATTLMYWSTKGMVEASTQSPSDNAKLIPSAISKTQVELESMETALLQQDLTSRTADFKAAASMLTTNVMPAINALSGLIEGESNLYLMVRQPLEIIKKSLGVTQYFGL